MCDRGGIRTPNPQSRNLIFYPVELRSHLEFAKVGNSTLQNQLFIGTKSGYFLKLNQSPRTSIPCSKTISSGILAVFNLSRSFCKRLEIIPFSFVSFTTPS